jgi:hypothetical protein
MKGTLADWVELNGIDFIFSIKCIARKIIYIRVILESRIDSEKRPMDIYEIDFIKAIKGNYGLAVIKGGVE